MTAEEDAKRAEDIRAFNAEPWTPFDQLVLPPAVQGASTIQRMTYVDTASGHTMSVDRCHLCGAMIFPMSTQDHHQWHRAIAETFQSQQRTNQSFSNAIGIASMMIKGIRNVVRPLVFPPTPPPQEPRSLKRRPRPKKGSTMSDIRKNENKAMDQADETTEDKAGTETQSYEQKVMDGLEKK